MSARYTLKRFNGKGVHAFSYSNKFSAWRDFGAAASIMSDRVELWCNELDGKSVLIALYEKGGINDRGPA